MRKRMKKMGLLCCIALLIGCMTGCSAEDTKTENADQTKIPSEEIKGENGFIGITTSMYTNEAIGEMCDIIAENLEREGYEVQISDANFDQALQTSQIEDFINQDAVLVIIEACDSVGVKSAYQKCRDAGIPTLSVSQVLDESVVDLPTEIGRAHV